MQRNSPPKKRLAIPSTGKGRDESMLNMSLQDGRSLLLSTLQMQAHKLLDKSEPSGGGAQGLNFKL